MIHDPVKQGQALTLCRDHREWTMEDKGSSWLRLLEQDLMPFTELGHGDPEVCTPN